MKKLTVLSMLLGLGLFVTGCGETKQGPKPAGAPMAGQKATDPNAETTEEPKEGDGMAKETAEPGADAPAPDEKTEPAGEENEKPGDEKAGEEENK